MLTHIEALETRLLAKAAPVGVSIIPDAITTTSFPSQVLAGPGGAYTVLGSWSGQELPASITFAPGTTAADRYGITHDFIASYSSAGKLLWVVTLDAAGGDGLVSEAMDASGNIYAAGDFGGKVAIHSAVGAYRFSSAGPRVGIIVKISPAGKLLQVNTIGGADSHVSVYAMALSAGNVFVQGFFTGATDFGPDGTLTLAAPRTRPGVPGGEGFLASYDNVGHLRWASPVGLGADPGDGDLAADGAGGVCSAAYFTHDARFGANAGAVLAGDGLQDAYFTHDARFGANAGAVLAGDGLQDAYVAHYTGAGALQWAQRISSPNPYVSLGDLQSNGHGVFVSGSFTGSLQAGGLALSGNADQSTFLISLDPSGHYTSARSIDGTATTDINPMGLALDASGNAYLGVFYQGTITIGQKTLTSNLGNLIARYSPSSVTPSVIMLNSSPYHALVTTVTLDPAGDLAVAGLFFADVSLPGFAFDGPTDLLSVYVLLHLPTTSPFPST